MGVFYFTPYSSSRDIGAAYNQYMRLLPSSDDWACFMDGDIMFLTPDFGHQIEEVVSKYPDTGMFTVVTNRVGNTDQCHNGIINEDPNMLNHRRIAKKLQQDHRHEVKDLNGVVSGLVMCIKKSVWEQIGGFPEGRGILAVDNSISKQILGAGLKIRLMRGVYVLHFYRLDVGRHNKDHLLINDQINSHNPQIPIISRKKIRSRFI